MSIDLVVEDGTMPDGANTYADIDFADAFLASRGAAEWAVADEDTKAAAIIRATDTLNSYRWKGLPVEDTRIMAWPRTGVVYASGAGVPADTVPIQVKNATCELAGNIVATHTDPLAQIDASVGAVTSEKVDVIGVSYAAPETNAYTGKTGFPFIDALLRPFLKSNGKGLSVVELGRG